MDRELQQLPCKRRQAVPIGPRLPRDAGDVIAVMTPADPPTPLSYGTVRLRWCGLALKAFVLRWGVYFLVTGLLLSAGGTSWQQVLQAVAAAPLLPLFWASQHGALLVPALLLQALAGCTAVWGTRRLLWPPHWADAERALPLPRRVTQRSDLLVVLLALAPLYTLYAAGTASVLAHQPHWLQPTLTRALVALALAALLSWALGVALLQRQRRYRAQAGPAAREGPAASARATATGAWRLPVWRALVLWPLWRGPARRAGRTLLLGCATLLVLALGPAALRGPTAVPWCLAAFAAVALLAATRVKHLALLETAGLVQGCAVLPVSTTRLRQAVASLGLVPLAAGLAAALPALLAASPAGLRPAVLAAWALGCTAACAFEVFVEQPLAADKSARWWFSLIVCVCLASEVVS